MQQIRNSILHFLILDLEATCWKGAPPNQEREIIEIGAIKLNRYGEEIGSFNRFVKPEINPRLSVFCQELTGIQQQQVDRAESFAEVFDLFAEWADLFSADYLLVTWGKEDVSLLTNDCLRHQLEIDWLEPHLNLKRAFRNLRGLRKPLGLLKCLELEGFEFEGSHHRAIDDAINTVKIFRQHLDEWQY